MPLNRKYGGDDEIEAIATVEELLVQDVAAGLVSVDENETVARWLRRQRQALRREDARDRSR